jgi:hypothetical protein
MPRTVTLSEELADDGLAREGRQGDRSDKLLPRRGDDNLNLCSLLDKFAYDDTRLIGSDAASDAEYYLFPF